MTSHDIGLPMNATAAGADAADDVSTAGQIALAFFADDLAVLGQGVTLTESVLRALVPNVARWPSWIDEDGNHHQIQKMTWAGSHQLWNELLERVGEDVLLRSRIGRALRNFNADVPPPAGWVDVIEGGSELHCVVPVTAPMVAAAEAERRMSDLEGRALTRRLLEVALGASKRTGELEITREMVTAAEKAFEESDSHNITVSTGELLIAAFARPDFA